MTRLEIEKFLRSINVHNYKQNGDWINSPCPLAPYTHAKKTDRRPSFGIAINDFGYSNFNCYACGHTGRLEKLVKMLAGFDGRDYSSILSSLRDLDGKIKLPDYEDLFVIRNNLKIKPKPLSDKAYSNIFENAIDSKYALAYLRKRHIKPETAQELDLKYDPQECRILFAIRDIDNNLYGYSGRSILPDGRVPLTHDRKKTYPKVRDYFGLDKKLFILGEERFKEGKPVLIVEGLFAYASLIDIGAEEVFNVGALLGNKLTEAKRDRLIEFNHTVYLLLDNDEGGRIGLYGPIDPVTKKHTGRGAVRALRNYIPTLIPRYPKGKIDPDELIYEDVLNIYKNTKI